MLEYEVTHEPGFAAVDDRCEQRLVIELYQLESGWTVFGRYSGTEREEKVDHAELDEFAELAQRLVFALLRNKPISHTITRENVLRADSERTCARSTAPATWCSAWGRRCATRTCRPRRGRRLPARPRDECITPLSIQLGYRRKLRAWGLDAFGRLNLGTENTGVRSNDLGGHVDYSKSGLLGLNFLHYTDAPGINSFYFGGGAAFEIAQFEVIRPHRQPRRHHTRLAAERRAQHRPAGRLRIHAGQLGALLRAARGERARIPGEDRERFGWRSTPGCPA